MKFNITSCFALAAATATGLLSATSAYGFNLRTDRPDLFNVFNERVNQERLKLEDSSASLLELDPETLRWTGGVEPVDVFFVNEGAKHRNQLLYSVNGGQEQMIFDDIASPESIVREGNGPLSLGDGVRLGTFEGDTALNFIIKSNGAKNSDGHLFGAQSALNPDGLQHVVAYEYFDEIEQQNWVILGFEDLFGVHKDEGGISDRDFNDVIIAVRGVTGSPITASVPEPSSTLALLGLAGLGITGLRRGKKESN